MHRVRSPRLPPPSSYLNLVGPVEVEPFQGGPRDVKGDVGPVAARAAEAVPHLVLQLPAVGLGRNPERRPVELHLREWG